MIQRIQTLYLFIAFLASSVLMFFFPLATYPGEDAYFQLMITGIRTPPPLPSPVSISPYLIAFVIALTAASGLFDLIALLSYKTRLKQLKIIRYSLLIKVLLVVLLFVVIDFIRKTSGIVPDYGVAMFFPLASLVFLFLAQRSIQADERKIKAADRLRP